MQTTFLNIGKSYTEGNEKFLLKMFNDADWQELPLKQAPFSQGYAVQTIINEMKMPAKRVSLYNGVSLSQAHYGVYGIETKKQRVFILDNGCELVPLALIDL